MPQSLHTFLRAPSAVKGQRPEPKKKPPFAAAAGPGSPRYAALAVFSGGPMSPTLRVAMLLPTLLLFGGRTDRALVRQTGPFQHALRAAYVPFAMSSA
jgi:hypothetical protein